MPLNWINIDTLSFNSLLLLERAQLSWFPGWLNEYELALAISGNPAVEWYLRHKCPEIDAWVDGLIARTAGAPPVDAERLRQAELAIMRQINDLLVYAIDPSLYDAQLFNAWDSDELRSLTTWSGKTVIDIGSGTGRLALVAAEQAQAVFAVEPVANLRCFIRNKARQMGLTNLFTVDGLITELPFPGGFADVTMGGHVFGGHPAPEYAEMARVTRPGGMLILCPGTSLNEQVAHDFLVDQGFSWSIFEEPGDGPKRKYWKTNP